MRSGYSTAGIGAVSIAISLACGGVDQPPTGVPAPVEPSPAPVAPAVNFEPAVPAAPSKGGVEALVLAPGASGCDWRLWTPTGTRTLRTVPGSCPTDLWFQADGHYVTWRAEGDAIGYARGADAEVTPPLPVTDLAEIRGAWVDGDGVHVALHVYAASGGDGDPTKLKGGGLSVEVVDSDHNAIYALFVLKDGVWTLTAAEPADIIEGIATDPTIEPPEMKNAADFAIGCGEGGPCSAPASWQQRDDLLTATKAGEDEGFDRIGFVGWPGGGFVFHMEFGDSIHAISPLWLCRELTCAERVAVEGAPEGQLEISLRGDYALVGTEYSGAGAQIYKTGEAKPVQSFASSVFAAWVPETGLPTEL